MKDINLKTKCRICRGPTNQNGYLYKCLDKNCGSVFWHRKVLEQFKTKLEPKDPKNKTSEKEVLSASNIPIKMKGNKRHMYVIKLSKKKGYDLICVDSKGVNAFFVRKDLMRNSILRKMKSKDVFVYNKGHNAKLNDIKNIVKKYNLVTV